jgi:hypothetical protein
MIQIQIQILHNAKGFPDAGPNKDDNTPIGSSRWRQLEGVNPRAR